MLKLYPVYSPMKLKIDDVFTPRRRTVNSRIYIPRKDLERRLRRAITGGKHTIVCGQSGSGKTWLYKSVAQSEKWDLYVANCASTSPTKCLRDIIIDALIPEGDLENYEYTQELSAEVNALITKGGGKTSRAYSVKTQDPLLKAFKGARHKSKKKEAVLVLENLEVIFRNEVFMNELASIILLLDDDRYGEFNIRILIVGVPFEIMEYFQKLSNMESVCNRLTEVPPVTAFSAHLVGMLVEMGFKLLKFKLTDPQLKEIKKYVYRVTLGIPQRIHEYCRILAFEIEESKGQFESEILKTAAEDYRQESLLNADSVVARCMNNSGTSLGRRNQVIYALSTINNVSFDSNFVEEKVRSLFPKTTYNIKLQVGGLLSALACEERPLLTKNQGGNYRFRDPRYLMCLRIALREDNEKVTKLSLKT